MAIFVLPLLDSVAKGPDLDVFQMSLTVPW